MLITREFGFSSRQFPSETAICSVTEELTVSILLTGDDRGLDRKDGSSAEGISGAEWRGKSGFHSIKEFFACKFRSFENFWTNEIGW